MRSFNFRKAMLSWLKRNTLALSIHTKSSFLVMSCPCCRPGTAGHLCAPAKAIAVSYLIAVLSTIPVLRWKHTFRLKIKGGRVPFAHPASARPTTTFSFITFFPSLSSLSSLSSNDHHRHHHPHLDTPLVNMRSPEHHQPQESQNHDDSHLSVPQPPPLVHHHQHQSQSSIDIPEGPPAFQRNLSFQVTPTSAEQPQRGRSFTPGSRSNNTFNTRSNPGSRATSRSRPSNKSGSKPSSRPVSWLISANSDYTSMYENFGGSRSRRTSLVGDDLFSNAEKGVHRGLSSPTPSYVGGSAERSSGEKSHHQSTATSEESTQPEIVGQSSLATTLIREGSLDSVDTGSSDERRPTKGNVSAVKASFLLIKAFVGTGILFLPRAFSRGGNGSWLLFVTRRRRYPKK